MTTVPHKYVAGLTRKQTAKRKKEIARFGAMHWRDPRAYTGFATDALRKTRRSRYTSKFHAIFPAAHSLEEIAAATKVPLRYLREVYNRGMAAWRTGHRPGATQQQWGYARVHSFLLCGKTHYGPDSDLVREATAASDAAKEWFKRCR